MKCSTLRFSLIAVAVFIAGCTPGFDAATYQQTFEEKTGLRADRTDESSAYLSKTHNGYPVLARVNMGNVWGRYAARLAAGEIASEVGRVGQFLTGSYDHVGTIVGSPFDRLLSQVIGQPMSLAIILKHGKGQAPPLDIVSSTSALKPTRTLPKVGGLGRVIGESVFSSDPEFWRRIDGDPVLHANLSKYRSYYVMVDDYSVSFLFAGSENEYSGMIREFPTYEDFILSILDTLAGIADRIPPA